MPDFAAVLKDGISASRQKREPTKLECGLLGAQDYSANCYLDERQAVALLIFQRPGSNAR